MSGAQAATPGCYTFADGILCTRRFVSTYVNYKRENEVNPVNIQPHPHEFKLYYDA